MKIINNFLQQIELYESKIKELRCLILEELKECTNLSVSERYNIWVSAHDKKDLTKSWISEACHNLDEIGFWDKCELDKGRIYNFVEYMEDDVDMEYSEEYQSVFFKHLTEIYNGDYDKFVDNWKLYAMENDHNAFVFDW